MALKKVQVVDTALEVTAVEMTTDGVTESISPTAEPAKENKKVAQPVEETEVVEQAGAAEEVLAEDVQSASQEVAVADSQEVAQSRPTGMASFTQTQADAGYEGLELTGMSFDRIKLHEGQFKLGSDEEELGVEFDCVVYSTREIYVVRQSTDSDAEAFYSYDATGQTFTDGTCAKEKLEEWLDDGYGTEDTPLDIRPYLEATAVLVNREDDFEGHMVMLSIPPSSKARLAGAAAQAQVRFRGATLGEVVLRAQVGKKVGEGQKAFRPWTFKVIGTV